MLEEAIAALNGSTDYYYARVAVAKSAWKAVLDWGQDPQNADKRDAAVRALGRINAVKELAPSNCQSEISREVDWLTDKFSEVEKVRLRGG